VVIFTSDGDVGYKMIDFESSAWALPDRFTDFGLFGLRQDADGGPLLFGFPGCGRHAAPGVA